MPPPLDYIPQQLSNGATVVAYVPDDDRTRAGVCIAWFDSQYVVWRVHLDHEPPRGGVQWASGGGDYCGADFQLATSKMLSRLGYVHDLDSATP